MIVAMVVVGFDAGTMVCGTVVAIMPFVIEVDIMPLVIEVEAGAAIIEGEAGAAIIEVEAGAATIEIEVGSMEFRSWPFMAAVRLTIPNA